MARQLQDRAAQAASGDGPVDLCIINTCTVTGKASMQSRQAVRRATRANPNARIVVTGCYAQTAPQEILDIPGVDLVLGNDGKPRIADMVCNRPADPPSAAAAATAMLEDQRMSRSGRTDRARPFLKIQDGCNARCSYCIVPVARGVSRSLPVEDALSSIERLNEAGYPEIVLTGIHLGHYGLDLDPPSNLLSLLKAIRQLQSARRVRLSSIEPQELTGDLIRFVASAAAGPSAICPHFHVPLQSGDDDILRRMNRPYTREFFRELILRIKHHLPDASVGVDVLVGFPGESEAAFENTCALLDELPVTYLHVFPFSRRSGTPADLLPDQVPAAVLKARCRQIRLIGYNKKLEYYTYFINKTLEVVAESIVDADNGWMKGTSANYLPVMFRGRAEQIRTIVPVRIERVDLQGGVTGTVVS